MAKTRSITRNQNHDDDDDDASSSSSSRKRFKTFDNIGVSHWSNLSHDVIFLVMMKLGVVDFVAFSGVCKSWRSFSLSNRNMFMASKPPMEIYSHVSNEDSYWYLEDFERRRFRTFIPHSAGKNCVGLTCGYLILFSTETRDFWLVNPITRRELHFPDFPLDGCTLEVSIRAILVFSPSISGWVFVVLHRKVWCIRESKTEILFCIPGKQGWNHVAYTPPPFSIRDLHAFKGKIYTLHYDFSVCELRLDPNQLLKWMLLETKNFPKPDLEYPELTSSGENLYVMVY